MMEVGIRELRSNLASILDAVDKGEVVTITHHGAPRATLHPVHTRVETGVERGMREGWLHPGPKAHARRTTRRPTAFLTKKQGRQAWEALMRDREDDR
jgi:prevent-host-death family protein